MKFKELNLKESILKNLNKIGYEETTEIQELCIPAILKGGDVIGLSQTGSGKTLAYGIPAVMQISEDISRPQVLVVCPTRELATQICDEIKKITIESGLKVVPVYGGSNMDRQIVALKRAQIVVGTPGRLMDHLRRRTLKLDQLKTVVLDEADEMLNMGFREDIETILKAAPGQRQMVMFSATMPKAIMDITNNFMTNPEKITASKGIDDQRFIEQHYISVSRNQKNDALVELFKTLQPNTAIIFCNTKKMVDTLGQTLAFNGIMAFCMHGDKRQSERKRILDGIKKNGKGILIGTDVVARGIDINNVDAVINFDMPADTENYIHRIGRTARAGKTGKAFSIVNTKNQKMQIKEIEHETKNVIKEYKISISLEETSEDKKFFSRTSERRSSRFSDNNERRPSRFSDNRDRRDSRQKFSKPYEKRDNERKFSKPFDRKESEKNFENKGGRSDFARTPRRDFTDKVNDNSSDAKNFGEKKFATRKFDDKNFEGQKTNKYNDHKAKYSSFETNEERGSNFTKKPYKTEERDTSFTKKSYRNEERGSNFSKKPYKNEEEGFKSEKKFGNKSYASKSFSKDKPQKQNSDKKFGFKKDGWTKPSIFKKKPKQD